MARSTPGGAELLQHWNRLEAKPLGRFLFNRLLRFAIPYTGSIRPDVQELEPGHAIVVLHDKRHVRNHLNSIHAIALANLAELTTGLATLSGMPETARGILAGLEVEYVKKARGRITGECWSSVPETSERKEYLVEAILTDSAGDIVATGRARWLIGPRQDPDSV